jgi:hypothetical protein
MSIPKATQGMPETISRTEGKRKRAKQNPRDGLIHLHEIDHDFPGLASPAQHVPHFSIARIAGF